MEGLCRTANTCQGGLVLCALQLACDGLCTAASIHTAEEYRGCFLECHEGLDCTRHYNRCSALFESAVHFTHGDFQRASFQNCRPKHRLCILVAGLFFDSFVMVYNPQITIRGRCLALPCVWKNQDDCHVLCAGPTPIRLCA